MFEYRKARRKDKDSTSGAPVSGVGGSSGFGSNEEGKLYLETQLLERHLNETEMRRLVEMPTGLEENEWMASHSTIYHSIIIFKFCENEI